MSHPQVVGGKYRLEECLGEGALGVVYRAIHLGLEKSFAVKLLKTAGPPSPAALARFRKEAVALGRLHHPHIVGVTDSGIDETSRVPYLVMECLQGVPLADAYRGEGGLPLAQALPLLEQIANAIDAAHGAGVLHRDLKPANVLVTTAGVKVLDFGLADLMGAQTEPASHSSDPDENSRLTATGALQGTPLYAAPELIRHGEASPASDVYSFGVIAYELLSGGPPFQGTAAEVLASHLEADPPRLPLPAEVWEALRQPLQKDPALRPASAGEVVRRLRQGAARTAQADWRRAEIPRRTLLAALLATLLLAIGLRLPSPALPGVERWIGDLRVRTAPTRSPDPRILLVTFDQPSLDSSPRPLADRADEIGSVLAQILAAGARGVAIDFLLPRQWRPSREFANLVLRHSDRLTLAASSSQQEGLSGTECLDPLTVVALGPRRAAELFGFVNLDEAPDGVVRRGRLRFRDRSGFLRPSWAAHAARRLEAKPSWRSPAPRDFWIDARIDWPRYARITWRQVPTALQRSPELFRDRLVLVGGAFVDSDAHRIAGSGQEVSGLILQALMVDTIAAGLPIGEVARPPVLTVATLWAVLAMAGLLCVRRTGPIVGWLIAGATAYVVLSLPAFWWEDLMLPVTSPLLILLSGLVVAFALRRILPSPPEVSP